MNDNKPTKEKRKRPKLPSETALDQVAQESGLKFPVSQTSRALKKGKYSAKVGDSVPVYMAAVLEYVTGEVLELAGKIAADPSLSAHVTGDGSNPNTITPAHIEYILERDSELCQVVASISDENSVDAGEEPKTRADPGSEESDEEEDDDPADGGEDGNEAHVILHAPVTETSVSGAPLSEVSVDQVHPSSPSDGRGDDS